MDFPFPQTEQLLRDAIARKECSGLACYARIGREEGFLYLGTSAHADTGAKVAAISRDTLFDLASLTKILSTVFLMLFAIEEKKLRLDDAIQKYFPQYPYPEVTITDLLEHHAGFVWHEKFYERFTKEGISYGPNPFLTQWILETKITAPTEAKTEYSDLDFLLLGTLLEKVYQKDLFELFLEKIFKTIHPKNFGFRPLHGSFRNLGVQAKPEVFAATEQCPWRKKILQGEVHDDNAWALGGIAGHAGLFGNLQDTKKCFLQLINKAEQINFFEQIQLAKKTKLIQRKPFVAQFYRGFMLYPGLRAVDGNEWEGAIGHTGFTGTSAWFHLPTQACVVLLANRIHPTRDDNRWITRRLEVQSTLWHEGHS